MPCAVSDLILPWTFFRSVMVWAMTSKVSLRLPPVSRSVRMASIGDVDVFERHALAESAQRVVGEPTEVDLLDHAAELVGYRRLDLPHDELHGLLQTQAGLEAVRHQEERVDQLIVDGVEPLVAHVEHDAPRPEVAGQTEDGHRDGPPEQAIAEEQTNQKSADGRPGDDPVGLLGAELTEHALELDGHPAGVFARDARPPTADALHGTGAEDDQGDQEQREGDVEDRHDQAVWWRKISRGTLTPRRARLSTNAGMYPVGTNCP